MLKQEIIMRGKQLGFPRLSKKSHDNQATMITTIVQEAIKAEREACAKLCDDGVDTEHPTVKGCIMKNFGSSFVLAAAIRARGEATLRGEQHES